MAKVKVTFQSKMKAYLQVQQMNMQKELEAKATRLDFVLLMNELGTI